MDRSTLSRSSEGSLERRGLVVLGPEERLRARKVTLTDAAPLRFNPLIRYGNKRNNKSPAQSTA